LIEDCGGDREHNTGRIEVPFGEDVVNEVAMNAAVSTEVADPYNFHERSADGHKWRIRIRCFGDEFENSWRSRVGMQHQRKHIVDFRLHHQPDFDLVIVAFLEGGVAYNLIWCPHEHRVNDNEARNRCRY
jgi:hypothetical protein